MLLIWLEITTAPATITSAMLPTSKNISSSRSGLNAVA